MRATVEELRRVAAAISGEIAARAGRCIVLEDCGTVIEDAPQGGAVLDVYWCTDPGHTRTWFDSVEGAKAAILSLARKHGRLPSDDYMSLDLTAQGCLPSYASIVVRS